MAAVDGGGLCSLADLLTRAEEAEDDLTGTLRWDIPLLCSRIIVLLNYLRETHVEVHGLPIGTHTPLN